MGFGHKKLNEEPVSLSIENPVYDHTGTDDIELQVSSPTPQSAQNNNTKPPPNPSSGDNPASNGFVVHVPVENEISSPTNQELIKGERPSRCIQLLTLHRKILLALLALFLIIIITVIVVCIVFSLNEKTEEVILNKETAKHQAGHQNCDQHMDPYSEWQSRLFDGSSQTEGELYLFHREGCEHSWIKVCADDMTHWDKQIACKSRVKKVDDHVDTMDEKRVVKIKCQGDESSLSGCRKSVRDKSDCVSSSVQLDCENKPINLSAVSLYAFNNNRASGYLNLKFGGKNGLICKDNWNMNNSVAVCKQLGYRSARNTSNIIAGQTVPDTYSNVPIYNTRIHCNSSDTLLTRCSAASATPYNCEYRDAVSIYCVNVNVETTLQQEQLTSSTTTKQTTTVTPTDLATTQELTTLSTTSQPRVALSPNATAALTYSKSLLSTGILEITEHGEKFLVCDDEWTMNEGRVACRMAGFVDVETADHPAFFDMPSGDDWILPYLSTENAIKCNGTETHLSECSSVPVRSACSHYDEVVLECLPETLLPSPMPPATEQPFTTSTVETSTSTFSTDSTTEQETTTTAPLPEFELRLLPAYTGSDPSKGRLEIFVDGVWGTVCDDGWSVSDAEVVCRELNYDTVDNANQIFDGGQYGRRGKDPQPIHVRDVHCNGTERWLSQCSYDRNTNLCTHQGDDLLMSCKNNIEVHQTTLPPPFPLRLNPERHRGRLEVQSEDTWHTVCDDGWDEIDAVVACRQLGYSNVSAHRIENYDWSEGQGYYLMTEVHCTGNETALSDCDFQQGSGFTGCSGWFETVPEIFLECSGRIEDENSTDSTSVQSTVKEIRLVSGSNSSNVGMLSVYSTHPDHLGARWGKVCDKNYWNRPDAEVACRQLGFPGVLRHDLSLSDITGISNAALRMPYNGNMFRCDGDEETLVDCIHTKFGSCPDNNEVVIECEPKNVTTIIDDTIRLVNGDNDYEGILEVNINGTWGRVCEVDGDWSTRDGELVCVKMFRKEHSFTHTELGQSFNVNTTAELSPYVGGQFRCDSMNQTYNTCSYVNDDSYIQSCSSVILTCF